MIAMGPQEDYIETVVTCEGDFHDPELHSRLEEFRLNLKELLSTDSNKVILKKVEPWNSVRVTFNITKEAALRLKQLAQQGNAALRSLGVLAVQIEGDQIISLTIAGRNNERAELILKTSDNNRPGPCSVPVLDSGLHSSDEKNSPGPSNVETTRKNIADYLRKGTSLFDTIFNPSQSMHGHEVFRSPNVVATSSEPIPFKPNNILSTSLSSFHGSSTTQTSSYSSNFPPGRSPTGYPATHSPNYSSSGSSHSPVGQPALKFPSPPVSGHGIPSPLHPFQNMTLPPPPPYPHTMGTVNNVPRHGKTVTAASPLLVNLLQTEPLVAGLSNLAGQKMLPPNEGGPPVKKKRRPRKPKDSNKLVTSIDGEIPIESIPNPALNSSNSLSKTAESEVSSIQSGDASRIPYLPHQTNHTQSVKDCSLNSQDSENVLSSGANDCLDDPFPPEVTAGKIVNPYTGKLEPISDLSPNKSKPASRSIDDSIVCEKLSSSASDQSMMDIKLRIGPLLAKAEDHLSSGGKQSVAATQTSTLTTQNITPMSNNNSHPLNSVRSVAMVIYATAHSSHGINATVKSVEQTKHNVSSTPAVKLEPVVYSGVSSVSSVPKSISKSSVMQTLTSGTSVGQPNKPHNALAVSSPLSTTSTNSSSFISQDSTSSKYSRGIQSHSKLDSLSSLNSPNIRNTDLHSITGSPNAKVLCEGDDGSNHSGIINDLNPEGTTTVSPLDSSGNKVYNHDSGVGSSSERSDDTPSEPGDEFRTTQVHVEASTEECLKPLKYAPELKNSKVMTVGYVMNHEQSSTPQNINSILNKDIKMSKFEHFLYGQKQNDVLLNNHHQMTSKSEKEQQFINNKVKKLHNGPSSILNEHNSLLDVKTVPEIPKVRSPSVHPSINNIVTGMGTGMMKDMSVYLKDNLLSENGSNKQKNCEKKRTSNTTSQSNTSFQTGKESEPPKLDQIERVSSHYNNCNDWPDLNLASSIFGISQISPDNFDSHHFEGLDFDSPPNSEKFAGFTEQDILQATAKGLAYKAQAALDGVKGSNITSKYSKRSSPVNVNMLNHLYAPGLPLPRRLTESVQRLVKPLPSNDHSLPHSRACKSPGSSKSSNGSASPRSCPGGARSPGANVCRSASGGMGQHFTGVNSNLVSVTSQQNTVTSNLTYNPHLQTSVSNSMLHTSPDTLYKSITDSTYQAYSSTTPDNYYQHHSNCIPSINTTHDTLEMAKVNSELISRATSQDTQSFQVDSVPSSVCNISVSSDIGAGFPKRLDSISENQDVHLSVNLSAMEQTNCNDLSKSASVKTIVSCGSVLEQTIQTNSSEGHRLLPSVDLSIVNKLVGDGRSDSTASRSVPPNVSSSFQHSTFNLSGSALTTQTSVSYSRQHGVSLTSVDIAKTVPSSPIAKNSDSVRNKSQDSTITNSKSETECEPKMPSVSEVNKVNSHNSSQYEKSLLCIERTSVTPRINSETVQDLEINHSCVETLDSIVSNGSLPVTIGDTSTLVINCEQTNHLEKKMLVTSNTTSTSPVLKDLENTPPLITASTTVESELPQRRLTRKRKSNNSESECSDAKEIKILDDSVIADNDVPPSLNTLLLSSNLNTEGSTVELELISHREDKMSVNSDDIKEEDMNKKGGRRNKPLAPAPVLGYSFFDTPVIQGRTRSQSTTPANEKLEQKEDVPIATQKRATRSIKQKDQSDTPANKRRRSRDHR